MFFNLKQTKQNKKGNKNPNNQTKTPEIWWAVQSYGFVMTPGHFNKWWMGALMFSESFPIPSKKKPWHLNDSCWEMEAIPEDLSG